MPAMDSLFSCRIYNEIGACSYIGHRHGRRNPYGIGYSAISQVRFVGIERESLVNGPFLMPGNGTIRVDEELGAREAKIKRGFAWRISLC